MFFPQFDTGITSYCPKYSLIQSSCRIIWPSLSQEVINQCFFCREILSKAMKPWRLLVRYIYTAQTSLDLLRPSRIVLGSFEGYSYTKCNSKEQENFPKFNMQTFMFLIKMLSLEAVVSRCPVKKVPLKIS